MCHLYTTVVIMRKVEEQMINAIDQNCEHWSKSSTSVTKDAEGIHHVYLHGNEIAQLGDDWLKVRHAGWRTNTTMSRLRALVSEYGSDTDYIRQTDFVWYVNDIAMTNDGFYGVA